MAAAGKVREGVRRFYNPESFNGVSCRGMLLVGMLAVLLSEVVIYALLKNSADLGELPHYITDAVIISISLLEVLLSPVLCWVGAQRRRSVMVGWMLMGLATTIPLFALPKPEITPDSGLCNAVAPESSTDISTKAAVRLSLLLINALTCALGRVILTGHGLAYLNEIAPSDNLHMHVGIIVLYRAMAYLIGNTMQFAIVELPWLQQAIVTLKYLIVLARLFSYPQVVPRVARLSLSDRGLFRSMGRVLSNQAVVLLVLAMGLLTAAWWGFGVQEAVFVQVKYNIVPVVPLSTGWLTMYARLMTLILGLLLAAYMYTAPVMPKYDRNAAAGNAYRMCIQVCLWFVLMTAALSCAHGGVAGAGDSYVQPACGQSCGCDRPWMEFEPVCAPEQMTTYFSPCHAGCSSTETVNSVSVFSNCTCAAGGRVIVGACADGSCDGAYAFHQVLVILVSTCSTLGLVWMVTLVLELVDKRDVAVAVGLIYSAVALFAFVGAHGFSIWISHFTCAFDRDSKCVLQNSLFVPWVGYSSTVLAGLAAVLSIIASIIVRRQKEPKVERF